MRAEILIPTRNRVGLLRDALSSARRQTHADLAILVSDDGSTDGTAAFLQEVVKADPRVRVVPPNPTPGLFENVTHLVRQATAPAICVLGDDDVLDPGFVEDLLVGLDSGCDISFTGHSFIDDSGQPRRFASWRAARRYAALEPGRLSDPTRVALRGYLWLGSCLFRRVRLMELGFDAGCGMAADWDLMIRASLTGPIYHAPGVRWAYRSHSQTLSREKREQALRDRHTVIERHHFVGPQLEEERVRLRRDWLVSYAVWVRAHNACAARRAIRAYQREGGSRLAPRFALASLIVTLPDRAGTLLSEALRLLRNL